MTAGVARAVELLGSSDGDDRRKRLLANASQLRESLSDVDIGPSRSWIMPVIYGPEDRTILLADYLMRRGHEGSVMEFPAVPVGQARIRLFVTSEHSSSQIQRCAAAMHDAAEHFGFLTAAEPTR